MYSVFDDEFESLTGKQQRIAFLLLFICFTVRFMMMMKMMSMADSKENDYYDVMTR